MKAYRGVFAKKDGSFRTMNYLKVNDLPTEFLIERIKGAQRHNLAEGMELVWDIDEKAFRIFNHNTALDKIEEFEYNFNPAS